MAFAEASASDKDAIRSHLQCLQDIMWGYRPCAHHPNGSDRRRILHSTDPSQVSRGVCSPCAQKGNDRRSKVISHYKLPLPKIASPELIPGLALTSEGFVILSEAKNL